MKELHWVGGIIGMSMWIISMEWLKSRPPCLKSTILNVAMSQFRWAMQYIEQLTSLSSIKVTIEYIVLGLINYWL